MKINKKFIQENEGQWKRIREAHHTFNAERWRWREILRRTRVSAAAKDVALSLLDKFGGGEGRVYPSHAALSADTGLDERTVRAAISKLHDAGLIVSMSRGSTSTVYFFADPTDTFVTVKSELKRDDNRHVCDGLTDTFMTVKESRLCQPDRHERDGNHDHLTRPMIMTPEHDTVVPGLAAPAGRPLDSFASIEAQGVEVPRSDQIDELLADAIRDADDTELLALRHQEIRDAMARRYGEAIGQNWWIVAEWLNGGLDWIEAISELERMANGEDENRYAYR